MAAFPKSARFQNPLPDDIPGPGHYTLPDRSPDPLWKKTAMGEKAGRFVEGERGPDTFGLYDTAKVGDEGKKRVRVVSGAGGVAPEKVRIQLEEQKHRLVTAHTKEISRLESKLARTETAREEATKEAQTLRSEVRTLTSTLSKTTSQLTKYQSSLPVLQSQLTSLQESHAASHARKDTELRNLKDELERMKDEVRRGKDAETLVQTEARNVIEGLTRAFREGKELWDKEREEKKWELVEGEFRNRRLRRNLDDTTIQVTELIKYIESVEEEFDASLVDIKELETECEWLRSEDKWARENRANEKEWRQRTRSEGRELGSLKEEVRTWEEWRLAERGWETMKRELEDGEREQERKEKMLLLEEVEVLEGNLELVLDEEIPRLEEELETLEEKAESYKALASRTERSLRDLQAVSREIEGDLEEVKRRLGEKEIQVEKEKSEKKRLQTLLGQTRSSETALISEVKELSAQVVTLHNLEVNCAQLRLTIDTLSRRTIEAENESRLLAEQNTELLSHGNPNQKIRQVSMIREALAESKKNHLSTISQLAAAKSVISTLETELDAYRSTSAPPALSSSTLHNFGPTRSQVAHPRLDDVALPVDKPFKKSVLRFLDEEEEEEEEVMLVNNENRKPLGNSSNTGGTSKKMSGRMLIDELW